MKQQMRVLGIDDSPFRFGDSRALIVGALVRIPNYLEGVMRSEVTVDGTDSTDVVIAMISESRYQEQIRAIMFDGIALAGFNVLDLRRIHESLGIPVISITRDKPDIEKMKAAGSSSTPVSATITLLFTATTRPSSPLCLKP